MTNTKTHITAAQTEAISTAAQLARTTWHIVDTDQQVGLDIVQVAFQDVLESVFSRVVTNEIAQAVFGGDLDSGSTKRKLTAIVVEILEHHRAAAV